MSIYAEYWDRYVTQLFPRLQKSRPETAWPGDEWSNPELWSARFTALFEEHGVRSWRTAVEIGSGAGKHTKLVFEAAPDCEILAYDVSSEFLSVLRSRIATELPGSHLETVLIDGERPEQMLEDLRRRGLVRRVDAVYSMDAMVHVDLQYLVAYLLTAALVLKPGGKLVVTVADATSELGFKSLLDGIRQFYATQGRPSGKFEWMSPELARNVLERLGFQVDYAGNWWMKPTAQGRDLAIVATLAETAKAEALAWALLGEEREASRVEATAST